MSKAAPQPDDTVENLAKLDGPKAFISYSWTTPLHRDQIREYADRLLADGVNVVIDQYDLVEGQDKYHFMEKMVTDPSVTHVLVFSDRAYAEKADARKAGVGTESQIMSKEIYQQVEQTKFIPIFCELDDRGEPWMPRFFQSRIGLDFSSPEKTNENWERLVRLLHGKPEFKKPAIGAAPAYLRTSAPVIPYAGKLASFKAAAQAGRPANLYRQDFLDSAFVSVDGLRVREAPESEDDILTVLHTLLPLRDYFIDWLIAEIGLEPDDQKLSELVIDFLERLLPLKFRPAEVSQWNDWWFDGHIIFVYEMFIYTIAVLLKTRRDKTAHDVFSGHYVVLDDENRENPYLSCDTFYGYSSGLEIRNRRLEARRLSPVADVIKERATRSDVTFQQVLEAESVIFADSILRGKRWFPHTLVFAGYSPRFPFFVRAADKRGFVRLLTVFGGQHRQGMVSSMNEALKANERLLRSEHFYRLNAAQMFGIEKWGTL